LAELFHHQEGKTMLAEKIKFVASLVKAGKLKDATKLIQEALAPTSTPSNLQNNKKIESDYSSRRVRPLGEVVAEIKKFAPPSLPPHPNGKPKIPDGAIFDEHTFTCSAGTRTYKTYIPVSLPKRGRGLIVMLHGCTQNASDFAAGTQMNEIAEKENLIVIYPNQSPQSNISKCWNWFKQTDQSHGKGEPAIIAGITSQNIAQYDVDPDKVYIAGLSAGGAMAVIMGQTYPNLFKGVGVHSGLPYKSANDVISAYAAMRGETKATHFPMQQRVIVFHGEADKTVHPSNALAMVNLSSLLSNEIVNGISSGGKKYIRTILRDENRASLSELWIVNGIGHSWSGGSPEGSYTDNTGPDASREMIRFFLNP
jgi:poly(hydroxyalkanoate) depolymerase family esterase